jgi:bromodomain-containing protein 7/9
MSPIEPVAPESSSDATLASGGDIASGSNGYNLRKVVSKFQPIDSSTRALQYNSGGYTNWTSEWENEFPGQNLFPCLSGVCPIRLLFIGTVP